MGTHSHTHVHVDGAHAHTRTAVTWHMRVHTLTRAACVLAAGSVCSLPRVQTLEEPLLPQRDPARAGWQGSDPALAAYRRRPSVFPPLRIP